MVTSRLLNATQKSSTGSLEGQALGFIHERRVES